MICCFSFIRAVSGFLGVFFSKKSLDLQDIDKESGFPYAESKVFDRGNYNESEYENWYFE